MDTPTTAPPQADDAVALLTRQHRQLEQLLEALVAAEGDAPRRLALARAGDELAAHLGAEEQVFYPAVRAARTEDILLESLEEHLSLKRLLADLLALAPDDETFVAKCKVLREQAEHHHKEEEEHLFPKVGKLMDSPARAKLGAEVKAHEDRLRAEGAPRERMAQQTDAAEPLTGPAE